MPKYYCDYCRSYLTHDSMSVRKSHLMGKNHIKYYSDYYEEQAKKLNIWEQSELPYELTVDELYKSIPRSTTLEEQEQDQDPEQRASAQENVILQTKFIPPPPPLANLPNPPPSVHHFDLKEQKNKIIEYMRHYENKNSSI